jgi:hypothetical protein
MSVRGLLTHAFSLLLVVGGLALIDDRLSESRTGGGERKIVSSTLKRVDAHRDATIFTFGCSTRLNDRVLSLALGVPKETILDGHMGGCHQGCSYAEMQHLLRDGRRFERAFFAYNLFEACEHDHSKRTLQEQMLLPVEDTAKLFALYLHAKKPARLLSRYVGAAASGAYADTTFVRQRLGTALFGKHDAKNAHRWVRMRAPSTEQWLPTCSFAPDDLTLKTAFLHAILDDLEALAERSTLVILPDRTLTLPDHAERWVRYRSMAREAVALHPHVELLDLSEQGELTWNHFRDGVHLSKIGHPVFERRVVEGLAPAVAR